MEVNNTINNNLGVNMKKYCKVVNQETKQVNIGLGENEEFYKSIGYTIQEVEQDYRGQYYLKGYAPEQPLEMVKEYKLKKLKENCENFIFSKYPIYTQINIVNPLGEYTEEDRASMNVFINEARTKYNFIKEQINNCKNVEDLNNINVDFNNNEN